MRYYDFITQFEGIEHSLGDLANDIKKDVESDEGLLDIFEGNSFSDIYDHLINNKASQECMNTFVQSWAAYLKHEKKAMKDPLPALVLYQLSQLNKGLESLGCLERISESLDEINETLTETNQMFDELIGEGEFGSYLRINGVIDTFEQNG